MDQPFESDVIEDLAVENPLSSAEEFDEFEGMEEEDLEEGLFDEMGGFAADDAEEGLEDSLEDGYEEEFEDSFEDNYEDAFPREDSFEEGYEEDFQDSFEEDFEEDDFNEYEEAEDLDALDALNAVVADALDTKETGDFLHHVASGLPRATSVARQVGRLVAEGADEFEVLDEMLNLAEAREDLDAAIPIIAGLTIRTTMPRVSRLPRSTRRQLVRSVSQSTRMLTRRLGTEAVRAVPCVVGAVQRTAQRQRMPTSQIPEAVRHTTARVAQDGNLVRRLVRSSRPTRIQIGKTSCRCQNRRKKPRRILIRGPVEIIIGSY